ncbi:uncharacterized protein LOC132301006 [Cornus florida]|uniref:uncharacterized protein LOC132301006 n=1 Tax=Cornus florida TaxID=4283 RepID=UPI00289A5121|nr:uncharacterized protein LOC132301006 [Cornus florida]
MDKTELLRLSNDLSMKAMFIVNDNIVDIYIDDGTVVSQESFPNPINLRKPNEDCGNSQLLNNDIIGSSLQESASVLIKCKVDNYPWKLTAGCEGESDTVRVKRFKNVHTHTIQDASNFKPVVRSNDLGRIVMNKIRETPSYFPRQISKDFKNDFRIKINYMQSWRTKEHAKEAIDRKPEDSYKLVPWMCQRLRESMPGTIAKWTCAEEGKFKQLFVSYRRSIRGFEVGCRPFLSIDACHLSGNYKGTLLGAIGYDADDGLYHLAYAVVSGETDKDWLWFLQNVKEVMGGRIVTIITDRNSSLISGVRDVLGSQCHSWCLRHLMENFTKFINSKSGLKLRGSFKNTAKKFLNKIAYARTTETSEKALQKMAGFRKELFDWVSENGPEHWANTLFPLPRWDCWETAIKNMETERWPNPVGPNVEDKMKKRQLAAHGFSCMPCGPTGVQFMI